MDDASISQIKIEQIKRVAITVTYENVNLKRSFKVTLMTKICRRWTSKMQQ